MTPDQLRLDETHAWLERARRDLRAAKLLLTGGTYAEALFHCQQAVEKALKAFLTFHQTAFGKTHDLSELNPQCLAIDTSLRHVLDQSGSLTKICMAVSVPGGAV